MGNIQKVSAYWENTVNVKPKKIRDFLHKFLNALPT